MYYQHETTNGDTRHSQHGNTLDKKGADLEGRVLRGSGR